MPVGGAVCAPVNKYIYIYCARLIRSRFFCVPGRVYKKRLKPAFYTIPPRWVVGWRSIAPVALPCARCGAFYSVGAVLIWWRALSRSMGFILVFSFGFIFGVFRLFTLCEKVNI